MSLIIPEKFQHIHRVMNTNIDGNRKVPFALTAIKVHSILSLFIDIYSCLVGSLLWARFIRRPDDHG